MADCESFHLKTFKGPQIKCANFHHREINIFIPLLLPQSSLVLPSLTPLPPYFLQHRTAWTQTQRVVHSLHIRHKWTGKCQCKNKWNVYMKAENSGRSDESFPQTVVKSVKTGCIPQRYKKVFFLCFCNSKLASRLQKISFDSPTD